MCAKLRTVAASNNGDHALQSLYYCLFAPRICGVVLRAHPVRGESHIQRNATGEVATLLYARVKVMRTRNFSENPNKTLRWSTSAQFDKKRLFQT